MIRDGSGIDAIIGALMMIMVCTAMAGIASQITSDRTQESGGVDSEMILDYVLAATVDLEFQVGGANSIKRTLVSDFLIGAAISGVMFGEMGYRNDPAGEVRSMIEFYLAGRCSWNLSVGAGAGTIDSITSDPMSDVVRTDAHVVERTLTGEGSSEPWIRFSLAC